MNGLLIAFILLAAMTLFAGFKVVTARKLMHAALWLILSFVGIALIFGTLQSGFFTVVQILVYVGAIAILVIFAVMLTRVPEDEVPPVLVKYWAGAAVAVVALGALIVIALSSWSGFATVLSPVGDRPENVAEFGKALVDPAQFALPFEVASVLLIAALIGAVYLTVERKGGEQ
ncbi:MAG TPA: NADH-quinone oxidoreductase subunit J [Bellilinea sp.]|nr:NADH-quinone oxidoreductase subunit J [Bellilinea sp.]